MGQHLIQRYIFIKKKKLSYTYIRRIYVKARDINTNHICMNHIRQGENMHTGLSRYNEFHI